MSHSQCSSSFHPTQHNYRTTFYPLMNSSGVRQPHTNNNQHQARSRAARLPQPSCSLQALNFEYSSETDWTSLLFPYSWGKDKHLSVPQFLLPELDFSPSPSNTWTAYPPDTSPTASVEPIHVICNVPLIAPVPLPYHSPTFLQFELPDDDENLSYPPYTQRPPKRKRDVAEDVDCELPLLTKRRVIDPPTSVRRPHRQLPPPVSQARVRQRDVKT